MKWVFPIRQKWILSLVLGGLAASSGWWYVSQKEKNIQNHYTMTTVLQVKKYMKADRLVTADLVEEEKIPVAFLPPTALQTKRDLFNEKGEPKFHARIGLLKGEQLTKSKLSEGSAFRGLAWLLQPEQTALTLRLTSEQAVGGFLQPGDFVNVYCTTDRTVLLFQRLSVLAVDRAMGEVGSPAVSEKWTNTEPNEMTLITLAMTASQAARAVLAMEKGRVVLTLSSPLESKINFVRPVEIMELHR